MPSHDELTWNGVNGATGGYLFPRLDVGTVAKLAAGIPLDPAEARELADRHASEDHYLAVKDGIDDQDLAQAGWGVVFAAGEDPQVRERLEPLLSHRRRQAATRTRILEWRPGDTKATFLARHGAATSGPVDPDTVPYYLLVVGDPETIPFRFQAQLDVQYAVGRIHFDTADEYRRYVDSVIAAETAAAPAKRPRRAVFFGVRNDDDPSTELSSSQLVAPLAEEIQGLPGWSVERVLGAGASKRRLAALLGGGDTPGLLFTAGHGVGFPPSDPRQRSHQGAIVCREWPGPKASGPEPMPADHYFSGDDVPDDADVAGLVCFSFGCYGAGTPRFDEFSHLTAGARAELAPRAFLSRLAQRLLAHPRGGALAFVGHVERAWGCSIKRSATKQTIVFADALRRILRGRRLGAAVEPLNVRYAEISTELTAKLEDVRLGAPPDIELARLWTANNDARSYVVLGDPAVALDDRGGP